MTGNEAPAAEQAEPAEPIEPYCLEFHVGRCRIVLLIPAAVEGMTITGLRKFFKWAAGDYYRNEESIKAFFEAVPRISAWLKWRWAQQSADFQKYYKSEDFDGGGNKLTDKQEIKRRKAHNRQLAKDVKDAKAEYDRFQKRAAQLEGIKGMYLD